MPSTNTQLLCLAGFLVALLSTCSHAAPASSTTQGDSSSTTPGVSSTTPATITTACGGKPADVVFLLDSSRSIWGPDFKRQLAFVQNVADQFDIRQDGTRVGVLSFGTYVRTEFDLRTQQRKSSILRAIGNIYQLQGLTRTDAALLRMRELMTRDVRKGVARIAIVLTDGDSEYPDLTRQEAALAHAQGIAVLAVGIGHSISRPELEAIASDEKYVFSAASFEALDTLKQILAIKTCEVSIGPGSLIDNTIDDSDTNSNGGNNNGNTIDNNGDSSNTNNGNSNTDITQTGEVTPPPKGCGGKPADLVFILDGSSSIWGPDFKKQLRFVQEMVGAFDISPTSTRVGVMTYGNKPRDDFFLGRHETEDEVKEAVGRIRHLHGYGTNTGFALKHMTRKYFSSAVARDSVVHIGIVITDGRSDDRKRTARQAEAARKAGIHLFAVGVGANTEFRELAAIASQPTSTHVFRVNNYDALSSIRELLAIETCKVTDAPTPTTTTTTTTTTTPTTTTTTTTAPPPADQGCGENSPADLVFALPPLAKPDDTKTALNFIKDLVQEFDVQDGSVRLGLVPKECLSVPGFSLRSFPSTGELLSSFEPVEEETIQLGTSDVLRHMRSSSFLEVPAEMEVLEEMDFEEMMQGDDPAAGYAAAHRRPADTKKIGIVFVDRDSPDADLTAAEAGLAKEDGIEVFVVAIGKDVSDLEVNNVATSESHIFHAADYAGLEALKAIMLQTMNDACSGELYDL